MKVRVVSDLHLEHRDQYISFINDFPESDVLILAGDICAYQQIPDVLDRFAKKANHIIYVLGNHECYGTHILAAHNLTREVSQAYSNVHWLENDSVTIESQTFHGCTLWFQERSLFMKGHLADFKFIKNFMNTMYDIHDNSRKYLEKNIKEGDMVITHHAPSFNSISPEFERSPVNGFYCSNMDSIIIEKAPAIHFHGHTHTYLDYILGKTRVICNPFGYAGYQEVPGFNIDLEIEL